MGSLKILHPNIPADQGGKFHFKKPVPNLLHVIQRESDPNRSPLGSPPTEKKRVRRYSNSLIATSRKPSSPIFPDDKENVIREEQPRPILKKTPPRPRCASNLGVTRCSHDRKVNFNAQVLVQYIGETDTCYEPLNTEHQDRAGFLSRNALRRLSAQAQLYEPSSTFFDSPTPTSSASSPRPSTPSPRSSTHELLSASNSNNPLLSKNVNISFSQNSRNITTMKFVVFMGPQYDPSNIVVKANMSGTRLRVVANLKSGDSTTDQYNERFQLPMQVDPYKVEARLDARGYLTVTAPLIEPAPSSVSV